jgi:hypothetical protein
VHIILFGATAFLGLCANIFLSIEIEGPDKKRCNSENESLDLSSSALYCGSSMLFTVLILQCLHRGVHNHQRMVDDLASLEGELTHLERETTQLEDTGIDVEVFKSMFRILKDPNDVKRIFGKKLELPPGITVPSESQQAEAVDKQLREVFDMFANGSATLGSKELKLFHLFLKDAAEIDKKVRTRVAYLPVAPAVL